jgi:polysaccharide biosynthesis protein PslH
VRVVMVDKFPPLPASDGGKMRSAALLRRLAERADVVLCCFENGAGDRNAFADIGIDLRTVPWTPTRSRTARGVIRTGAGSAARFWDARLARLVTEATKESSTDVLLVEHGQLSSYLRTGKARLSVLDLHNIDSALARSYARSSRSFKAKLATAEAQMLSTLERRALRRADVVVTVSAEDAQRLPARPKQLLVCPNGWEPQPPLPPATEPIVIFTALFSWAPNVDAALWFTRQIWPGVRRRVPDSKLLLVGKDPTPAVRSLASPSVEVTGTVADISPYMAQSRVAVAPLLSGGGTRLKVLEALGAGRPIVATSTGLDGLGSLLGHGAVVADDAAQMAAEIAGLLLDSDKAQRLGQSGHAAVRRDYAWDRVLEPLLHRIET